MSRGSRSARRPTELLWHRYAFAGLFLAAVLLAVPLIFEMGFHGVVALLGGAVIGLLFLLAMSTTQGGPSRRPRSRTQSATPAPSTRDARMPDAVAGAPRIARDGAPFDASPGRSPDARHPAPVGRPALEAAPAAVATLAVAPTRRTHVPGPLAPYVLENGTSAGRAPWRLPTGQSQPGIAADAATVGDLEIRAASIIGPGHRCEEPATARQDAYAISVTPTGTHVVIAVADGLSASASSDLGARVAVSAAARILGEQLTASGGIGGLDADEAFRAVSGEMVGTGRSRKIADQDLCSLLIVAAIPTSPDRDGYRTVWTAQVGDVSLWLHGPGGWAQHTGVVKAGFDRNAVDAFLPHRPDSAVTSRIDVPPAHSVAVMTDGLGDVLNDVAQAREFFTLQWSSPPHPASFLTDLCVDARGQTDDRTAVVVWCGADARRREDSR